MTLKDAFSATSPVYTYKKTLSYFGRHGTQVKPFGAVSYQTDINGYNQLIHPYSPYLGTGAGGFYIHSTGGEASNVRVGVNIQYPEEDFEVDGSIQIDGATSTSLKFKKSGASPHALCEIKGILENANGGQLEFYTKLTNGSVTKKLTISDKGAIGIGATTLYGNAGQYLRSGSNSAQPFWHTLTLGSIDDVVIALAPGATVPVNGELLAYKAGQGWQNTSVLNSISTTSFFNINSPLQLVGQTGTTGQVLSVASNGNPEWTTASSPGQAVGTTDSPTFAGLTVTGGMDVNGIGIPNMKISWSGNSTGGNGLILSSNTNGNIQIGNPTQGAYGYLSLYVYGNMFLNGVHHNHNTWSDDRIKSHEQILTGKTCIDYIKQIIPKKYKKYNTILTKEEEETLEAGGDPFKDKLNGDVNHDSKYKKPTVEYGFIAQEIEKIPGLQEIVTPGDKDTVYQLDYKCINTLLLGAVKDLIKRIETLESK